MNSLNPYILKIQRELIKLSNWQYFDYVVAFSTVILCFLIGRKTYESKFTFVLNSINDSQNQKRRLKEQLQSKSTSLKYMKGYLLYFKILTALVVILVGLYLYLNNFKVQISYLIWSGICLIVFWILVLLWIKYLELMITRVDNKLQRKHLSSESDAKQIMTLLGQPLCNALKSKFERQFELDKQKQSIKPCDLKKCHDEKIVYQQLYQLYKSMIGEMQKMGWCDTCSQSLNLEANDLKVSQVEGRLKIYKSVGSSGNLEKKKELANKLLEEWQRIEGKLPFICKRGCCVRFRVVLEQIKRKNHDKLRQLKAKLNLIK